MAGDEKNVDDGEACLTLALEISKQQQAKSLELRAASSLARLWRERDREAEAQDLLEPIINWFPRGLVFDDLKRARLLRATLPKA